MTARDFLAYARHEFRAGLACFVRALAAMIAASGAAFGTRKAE